MRKFIFLAVTVMFISFTPLSSSAQVSSLFKPFGGMSTMVTPCTCDFSYMITMVNGATNMTENFIYQPLFTTLYANFLVIKPGTQTLGLANYFPIPCMVGAAPNCASAGLGYPMTMVGTSL